METIMNMILCIIYDLLGLSGIALLIIISVTTPAPTGRTRNSGSIRRSATKSTTSAA